MNIVAVDLAAKFSAGCWMNDYEVIQQCDSWQTTETHFLDMICGPFDGDNIPDLLVVEDLPHGISYRSLVKDVCRIQGRIVERMSWIYALDRVIFVQPQLWREHYGESLKRGTGPQPVVDVAADFGYTAPPLQHRMALNKYGRPTAGEKATAHKVATDYCAAYLIGRWVTDYIAHGGDMNVKRIDRYTKV